MSKSSDRINIIDVEVAKCVLEKTEEDINTKFEKIRKKTYNPNTKGYDYEETVKNFLKYYLGGIFDFSLRMGVLDVEMKVTSIFNSGENEFDVIGSYNNSVPKRVYDRFVPYDSIAFITEVKQTLNLENLEKDLKKFKKLDGLKLGDRFMRYDKIAPDVLLQFDRPLRVLFYYETKTSNEKVTKILESNKFKKSWDLLLILKESLLVINTTLPYISYTWKTEKAVWDYPHPLLKALYFICRSTCGLYVDSWYLFWNLFRSIAPKKVN